MLFDGFKKESIAFLEEITRNNNKEWFEANRDRYEKLIKNTTQSYVVEMGEHLQVLVPTIKAIPKVNGSLFKIYRDIRFRRDKRPIKDCIGVIFWQGSGKRMQSSSFYMHFSPYELFFAAGIRGFDTERLKTYRDYIKLDKNRDSLATILENLQNKGYQIPLPKYKRVPHVFNKDISNIELTKYSSMYAYKRYENLEMLFSKTFIDNSFEIFQDLHELQQWVYDMTLTAKDETQLVSSTSFSTGTLTP